MKYIGHPRFLFIFTLISLLAPSAAAAPALPSFSLDHYRAQQSALNAKLAALKGGGNSSAQATPTPAPLTSKEIVQKKLDESIASLPLSGKLSQEDTRDLLSLFELITKKHGNPVAMAAMNAIMSSPVNTGATVAFVRGNRARIEEIVSNPTAIQKLLKDPKTFATQAGPTSKPVIDRALGFLQSIKKFMSPAHWWAIMSEFVGSFFLKFWSGTWRLVQEALTNIIGAEKLYELNADGTIKRDQRGKKMPRLYPQNSVNEDGEMERLMVPHKWFNILDDKQSLLGQVLVSGLDRSVASTFKSLDRLFFRPMVSTVLHIPRWKLSHFHYRVAMTEYKRGNTPVITPVKLGEYILAQRNPGAFIATGLPFNLRAIMMQKAETDRISMLHTAITKHLYEMYKPIWAELSVETRLSRQQNPKEKSEFKEFADNLGATAAVKSGTAAPQARNVGTQLIEELGSIAKDSLIAKTQDYPLAPYMAYANLALSIPQALFGFEIQGKPAKDLLDASGNAMSPKDRNAIFKMIDICEALARVERRRNAEELGGSDAKSSFKITIQHKDETDKTTYRIKAAPSTIQKLLEAQERGLKYYEPFMADLTQEPYETYIMKLIMPRLVMTFIPPALLKKLGIENLADAAAQMKLIQRHFKVTFSTLEAMSAMMATIKQFEGAHTFAGQYVRIGDTFYRLLNSISNLVDTVQPSKADPWFEKRLHNTIRNFKKARPAALPGGAAGIQRRDDFVARLHGRITDWLIIKDPKLLSVTQRQQQTAAMEKSGYANPVLVLSASEIEAYLNAEEAAATTTEEGWQSVKIANVNWAVALQKEDKTIEELKGKAHITYRSFLKILNSWYTRLRAGLQQDTQENMVTINMAKAPQTPKERAQTVAARAHRLIIHTFGVLSLNTNAKDEEFFTAGQKRDYQGTTTLSQNLKGFEAKINSNLARTLSHFKELVYVINRLYVDFGLRAIVQALDEHYWATGQKIRDIPLKVFAKIAVSEGLAHLVGYGADTLLKKMLRPLMQRITQLQETNMFGGLMLNQLANEKLSMLFGNTTNGRSNAYYAAHTFVKNLFDYGAKTTLKGSNLMGSVVGKFIPTGHAGAGVKEYQELALHAKMAAESGRAPSPVIAARLKKLGMDPEKIAAEMAAREENEEDMSEEEAQEEEAPEISPALRQLFMKAQEVGRTSGGAEAIKKFIRENMGSLPQKDQELLRKHGFGEE